MSAVLPHYHNFQTLAKAALIERGVLERMYRKGIISADAFLPHGQKLVPLFLQARVVEIIAKHGFLVSNYGRLPLWSLSDNTSLFVPEFRHESTQTPEGVAITPAENTIPLSQ